MKETICTLVGPTCTYKSKIAIELTKKYPFEIISADSRLIYKGMDIGTSKPTLEERKEIPHHMIDITEPDFDYSVGLYKKETEKLIQDIFSCGKIPLFVGGTGLYLNSVLLGLSIPEVKPDLNFRRQLKEYTQEELYKRLTELDPKATEIIHKNDNFRTIRALEVIYKTNKLFSKLKSVREIPFNVIWIGLRYESKEDHIEKIKDRTELFCNNGFIDEVKSLLDKYGELNLFKRTIGYSEAIDFLKNRINKETMIEKIILHTRQFAKRQMTWFKANKKINWVTLQKHPAFLCLVEHFLRNIPH
ncbi:MAG: tRNA (adenosine(37)-N6)-dimethylallyltransferase MiaA [Candidatus Melainabacteria bacterium]|nr:tRNA (adenosine(37)-N6)-dimethylallyltransferase MiaA [Candidatus Melainabacteria bacterium]